jgi:subtilisin family serine protease
MKNIPYIIVIVIFFPLSGLFSQGASFAPGEVLIQMLPNTSPLTWQENPDDHEAILQKLDAIDLVSRNLNIWRLRYDTAAYDEAAVFRTLRSYEQVIHVQRNHLGTFRRAPNDPGFVQQWHLQNTGQTNGLPGADVGILDAWSKTTGGVTVDGKPIVIAVIDDGIDLEHVDLRDNYWTNTHEIPDNGLDDDANGYVDDYHGWNASSGSGDMFSNGSHGTNVIGVIGAKGNNEVGVSGINWQVKIMPVILVNVLESAVLAAYDYVLSHRKLFNDTNGSQGAFVVATNSSWGLDFGKPDDAPLWCGMYDSLGVAGILSVAATANLNVDVDQVGDLPTACSSDFLISVTSSNRLDTRSSAAYGINSIDLAAPGESIYFTRSRDRYSTGSGTSFASPMVAGSIGLLYSANSPNLMRAVKTHPAETALEIKRAILEGVTKLPSFASTTSSGGRLHVSQALALLEETFNSCEAPVAPVLEDYLTNALIINWDADADFYESYNLRYRENGTSTWTVIENAIPPYTIANLAGCTSYDVELQGVCPGGDLSPFSPTQLFRTDNCCEGPRTVDTLFVQPNAARLIWRKILPADFYFVEIKEPQDTLWREIISIQEQILIRGLNFCTTYQVRISSVCALDTSDYSPVLIFQTKGCGACTEKVYCAPGESDWEGLVIDSLSLGSFSNAMSRNDNQYEDFTGPDKAGAERGKRYPFKLAFQTGQEAPMSNVGVWIDYNHDGSFDEDEERALYLLNFEDTTLQRNIAIPLDARIGTTRMRIAVLDADLSDTLLACNTEMLYFGKYEDYCIEILQQNCAGTPSLDTARVGAASADLMWSRVEEAIAYTFRWREKGEANWVEELSDTVTTWSLDMLEPCKTYEFEVRSVCLFDTSSYVNLTFNTRCPTSVDRDLKSGMLLTAFPNPFSHTFFLEVLLDKPSALQFRVLTLLGSTIGQKQVSDVKLQHVVEWPELANLPSGIYLIEVRSGDRFTVVKVQKE